MALTIRSVPWATQPQGPQRIARASPLSSGLIACVNGADGFNSVAEALPLTRSAPVGAGPLGLAMSTVAGSGNSAQFPYARPASMPTMSFMWVGDYQSPASAPNSFLFGDCQVGGFGFNWGVYSNGSNFSVFVKAAGTGLSATGSAVPGVGVWRRSFRIVCTYDGSTIRMYEDGVLVASTGQSGTVDSGAFGLYLNKWFTGGAGFEHTQNFYMGAAWSRALAESEAKALSANPWQLFAPQRRIITIAGAAGVPVLSAATAIDITATTARPQVTITF